MVGAHELLVALRALEALLARVRPPVPLQLVGAREPLAAEEPAADEGPLPAVPPQVRPQVRRLAVHLVAVVHVADVLGPNSIEKCWLEFWLEKSLEFLLDIPYTK